MELRNCLPLESGGEDCTYSIILSRVGTGVVILLSGMFRFVILIVLGKLLYLSLEKVLECLAVFNEPLTCIRLNDSRYVCESRTVIAIGGV